MSELDKVIKALLKAKITDTDGLQTFKRQASKKWKLRQFSNVDLLQAYHSLLKNQTIKKSLKIEQLLIKRPVRSLSGIVNISVLTKPYKCPGTCIYCPSQAGMPKSYLKGEPAAQRASDLKFDPFEQTKQRIEVLKMTGHNTDKIDLRVIGGTWSHYPLAYRIWFIKECFRACNGSKLKVKSQKLKVGELHKQLEQEQVKNETATRRIVGLSVETRPDFINEEEIKFLRELGATKVELGVQSIYDDVLDYCNRGHKNEATIKATKLLKDAGFKISYQLMPNLPKSSLKRDFEMFKEIFTNSDYKPDYIKIYPLVLLKEAKLYKKWQKKEFRDYTQKELMDLIIKIKQITPRFVRIERIIRDIPARYALNDAAKITNMRQYILAEMGKKGLECDCIRCREVKSNFIDNAVVKMFRYDYKASGGKEIFLTFESQDRKKLYSLLRLRMPSQIFEKKKHFLPVLQDSAIIREVHTFGIQTPISQTHKKSAQHKGLGKALIAEAENIVQSEFGLKKIAVIAAVGTRGYYRKIGYKTADSYLAK